MTGVSLSIRNAACVAMITLFLWPSLIIAQTVAAGEPGASKVVDMGSYRVSAPAEGKWKIIMAEEGNGVNFARYKEGVLTQLTGQQRGTVVSVFQLSLEPCDWRMTEDEAADKIIKINIKAEARDPETPGIPVETGETLRGDKKLRFVRFEGSYPGQGQTVDRALFLYFPPDFSKSHRYFQFWSSFVRLDSGVKLYKNPGSEPLFELIDSFEIVDPLEAASGPAGALVRAAASGDIESVRKLLDDGVRADSAVPCMSALSAAAFYGQRDILALLLERGADIDRADEEGGFTALHRALIGGEPEIAGFLIEKGAGIDVRTRGSYSALMYVVALGHPGLVTDLLNRGAAVNAATDEGETALILAAQAGLEDIGRILAGKGADLNIQTKQGWSALMYSVNKGYDSVAKWLVESGADVNLMSDSGFTALMSAASGGYFNIARLLVDSGAEINAKTANGWTPLMNAVASDQVEIVMFLLEKGADVQARTDRKMTALKLAKNRKNAEIVKLLQASGATK